MGYFYSPYHEIAMAIGLVLLAISAPSHFAVRNTGTILYICWAFLANLIFLINRIIWHDHVRNLSPLWCDISTKYQVGFSVAVGAASIVINRRLFKITRISSILVTQAQKRRDLAIDLSIGLGIPVLIMCLHVVVQGHRANIIQGIGCWYTVYNVPLAYPLWFMWPTVLSLIAIVFCVLSLQALLKRRNSLKEFLNSNASGLDADRYLRLMCFSAVELTIVFPLSLYMLLNNALNNRMYDWISWEDTHYKFNRFDQIPAAFFEMDSATGFQFGVTIWIFPFLSYLFFFFFGLGREQVHQYKRWFYAALKPLGIKPPQPNPYGSNNNRTWWQKLLCIHPSPKHSVGFGPADSIPVFRRDGTQLGSHLGSRSQGERPIPSARSKIPHPSIDPTLTLDFDYPDEKEEIDAESPIVDDEKLRPDAGPDVNKQLPASPTIVVDMDLKEHDGEKFSASSRMSTSSASSVAGSSRRVSAAIRDVEISETEAREIEARIQHLA